MAKKDFTQNSNPVYENIAAATAAEEVTPVAPAEEAQETEPRRIGRRPRKNSKRSEPGNGDTRINIIFTKEVYDFIKTMSIVRGETMTDFVNHVMEKSIDDHRDIYEQAIKFRNSF